MAVCVVNGCHNTSHKKKKDSKVTFHTHFLAGVMNVSLNEVHVIIRESISASPRLLHYVKFLENLKYEDGKYHVYFGEIKKLVYSFGTFWRDIMDEAYQESDALINIPMSVDDLIIRIDRAIACRSSMMDFFKSEFLPIESSEQRKIYDEIKRRYLADIEGLCNLKKVVEKLDNQAKRDTFAKSEFLKALNRKNSIFQYAYTYISMLLADRLPQIEGSMKDITQRLRKNVSDLQQEANSELCSLLEQLYEMNKEHLVFHRCGCATSNESLQVDKSIEKIRSQVIERRSQSFYNGLEEESKYFHEKQNELQKIARTLRKVKAEYEEVQRERAIYQSMNSTELPGSKLTTWQDMGLEYERRTEAIKDCLIRAAKSLMTFFSVRGPFQAVYVDNVGPYHIDEHGHQVYHFKSGLRSLHVDCERNFKEDIGGQRYFYDEIGRYIRGEAGQRVYQVQTCTSSYEIGDDTLLKKVTVDCGHSDGVNKVCGMKVRDLTDVEILPESHPVDISKTLGPETTRYLWEVMGAILPDALYDVGMLRPKNPIHYLAHRLLAHKYSRTTAQLRQKQKDAEAYRTNILKERLETAKAQSRAWKAKQVRKRKPEESDDANEWAVYSTYVATKDFIQSLNSNYYDYD